MKDATLKPAFDLAPGERAGVLLPLPLPPYDYKLPRGVAARRGLVVSAPLGPRQVDAEVWTLAVNARLTIYFIRQPEFFKRAEL